MAATFDPYYKWLGIPPAEQPPNHYRLLAINPFETDPDVIETAADQRMSHLRSLQTGQHAELTQTLLNQISTAKVCLLRPDKKREYDDRLRAAINKSAAPPPPPAFTPGSLPPSYPPAPVAAGPLDFIDNPSSMPKTGVWEPDPLPLSPRGAYKSNVAGYSSRKTKSSQAPIFAIVAGICLVGIAVAAYIFATQTNVDSNQKNSSNSATETDKHVNDVAPPNKPKLPAHPVTPKVPPPASSGDSHSHKQPSGNMGPKAVPGTPMEMPAPSTATPNPEPKNSDKANPPEKPSDAAKLPGVSADIRQPVPDQEAQSKAHAQLRELLKDDYSQAGSSEARLDLARKLLRLSSEVKGDAAKRYVMGKDAIDLAVEAGDADLAFEAIDGLDSSFVLDSWDLKVQTMLQLSHRATSAMDKKAIANRAISMAESASSAEKYAAAVEFSNVAVAMADSVGDTALRDQAHEARSRDQRIQKIAADYNTAKQTLASHSDDAAANLVVGRFLCLQKGDWKAGLPLLSQGSDTRLKKIAGMEAAAADSASDAAQAATDRVKLADAWWEAAENFGDKKSPFVIAMFARAKYWYQAALPGLSDSALEKAQKRANEDLGLEIGTVKMVYLDDLPEQDVSVGVGSLGKKGASGLPDGSPQTVSFRGVEVTHALAMIPSEKGDATVSFDIDRKFHTFTAVVGVQDKAQLKSAIAFELRGDNKLLWRSRPFKSAEENQDCNVRVGNYKQLKLIVHCAGDNDQAWAVWVNPILKR